MNVLTRDQILAANDLLTERVKVPEWSANGNKEDAVVIVRGMTGTERNHLEASVVRGQGRDASVNIENLYARMVSICVVDENGKRLFSDSDIGALGGKSAVALARVMEVVQRLSGMTQEDVEDLTKGLAEAPSDDSTSD